MTESFERAMAFMRKAITDDCDQTYCAMYDDDCYACEGAVLDRLQRAHEHEIIELQRQYEQNVIELQSAHEREMDAVRDPQRIGGKHAPDSFVYAIEQLREFRWQHATNDDDAIPYINGVAKAHDHEMEQLRRSRFNEGYVAGQRSMDAEHYAVALRLKHLPLDEDSHGNLSQVARAIWHSDFGWTKGACEALRDELVRLLGGVHDEPAPIPASRCACDADCDCGHGDETAVAYDELWNERNKAVCELRKLPDWYTHDGKKPPAGKFNEALSDAIGVMGLSSFAKIRDRLIHLLGGGEPLLNFSEPNLPKSAEIAKPESEDGGENCRITDELRELMDLVLTADDQAWDIADRIDEQHNELRKELEDKQAAMNRATSRWAKADAEKRELQRALREIAERAGVPHDVDLDEYGDDLVAKATLGKIDSMHEYIGALEWQRDRQRKLLDEYERRDTAESIVRDIHLGKVTDSQAVERISALP